MFLSSLPKRFVELVVGPFDIKKHLSALLLVNLVTCAHAVEDSEPPYDASSAFKVRLGDVVDGGDDVAKERALAA